MFGLLLGALIIGGLVFAGSSARGVSALEFSTGLTSPSSPVIMWIPGVGQTPEQIQNFIEVMGITAPISARWIIPRAPTSGWLASPSAEQQHLLAQWINDPVSGDALSKNAAKKINDQFLVELNRSSGVLAQVVQAARKTYGRRVIVVGWDQGGSLALALSSHFPDDVSIALSLAGWIPRSFRIDFAEQRPHTVLFHGKEDIVSPIALGEYSVDWLQTNYRPITWWAFSDAGHDFDDLAPAAWDYLRGEIGQKN